MKRACFALVLGAFVLSGCRPSPIEGTWVATFQDQTITLRFGPKDSYEWTATLKNDPGSAISIMGKYTQSPKGLDLMPADKTLNKSTFKIERLGETNLVLNGVKGTLEFDRK